MKISMFHRPGYIFTDKKNPKRGIMSAILGAISVASVCLAVYLTYQNKGNAPVQYGSVILLSLIFAVAGMVLGILAMLEKDIFRVFPVMGIVLNGLTILAGGFILYLGVVGM